METPREAIPGKDKHKLSL
jgi:hypothetical protein